MHLYIFFICWKYDHIVLRFQRDNSILRERNDMLTLLHAHANDSVRIRTCLLNEREVNIISFPLQSPKDVGRTDTSSGTSSPLLPRVKIEASPNLSSHSQASHRTNRQATEMSNGAALPTLQALPTAENNMLPLEVCRKDLAKTLPGSYRLSNSRDGSPKGSPSLPRHNSPSGLTLERARRSWPWRKSSSHLSHELSAEVSTPMP